MADPLIRIARRISGSADYYADKFIEKTPELSQEEVKTINDLISRSNFDTFSECSNLLEKHHLLADGSSNIKVDLFPIYRTESGEDYINPYPIQNYIFKLYPDTRKWFISPGKPFVSHREDFKPVKKSHDMPEQLILPMRQSKRRL